MKKQINNTKVLIIIILANVLVLSLLIGLSFLIVQTLFRGKIDKAFIPYIGVVFFLGSTFTTSITYRLTMRHFLRTEHADDVLKEGQKENKVKKD